MTSNQVSMDVDNLVNNFRQFSVDEQLALLWFIYEKVGQSITPAAPGAADSDIAGGLFTQVQQKSHPEQLEIMRALVGGANTTISREYGSLSANTKLAFWYFLAQGMDEGSIIPMPEDYELTASGKQWVSKIELEDFQQQITILRSIAAEMGTEPALGASI